MNAGICNHRSVVVENRNLCSRIRSAAASAADRSQRCSGQVVKQVLDVPAAVPADADEADPEWCGRPVVHWSSRHGDVSEALKQSTAVQVTLTSRQSGPYST